MEYLAPSKTDSGKAWELCKIRYFLIENHHLSQSSSGYCSELSTTYRQQYQNLYSIYFYNLDCFSLYSISLIELKISLMM